MIRFAHYSDIHLGYRQYGLEERFEDFDRAWQDAITQSLKEDLDFVVIAGDLFQKRNTDPRAFEQAKSGLLRFQEVGIPVVAIEGNHDRHIHNREYSWVRVLAKQGLLILLDLVNEEGEVEYKAYDAQTQRGGYVDLPCGVRVMGVRYRGERLKKDMLNLTECLKQEGTGDAVCSVLLAHTGIETSRPVADQDHLLMHHLEGMRPWVKYVGLGHIHETKVVDNFVFQPGSLESCSSIEAHPEHDHGFFLAEIDPADTDNPRVTLREPKRRPYWLLNVDIDGAVNDEDVQMRVQAVLNDCPRSPEPPIVNLALRGRSRCPEYEINRKALEMMVMDSLRPLTLQKISFHQPEVAEEVAATKTKEVEVSRRQIEQEVFADAYMLQGEDDLSSGEMAWLTSTIKDMALSQEDPASFFAKLDEIIAQQDARKQRVSQNDTSHASPDDNKDVSFTEVLSA